MQPGHHRSTHGFLDPDAYGVHPDVGVGVDEAHDRKDKGEHQSYWRDSDEREDEIDRSPGDHSSAASAKTPHDQAAQGGSDQRPEPAESEGQPEGAEVDPEPISDLG